jgi:transcriptional regulator with XRE-family HTH domain
VWLVRVVYLNEEGGMKLRGLRQARQRSGLSISQLAELTGLRRDTITHLEHGKEEPQPYVLRRLASALSTSTAELLGLDVMGAAGAPLRDLSASPLSPASGG